MNPIPNASPPDESGIDETIEGGAEVRAWLHTWSVPPTDPAQRARLTAALHAELAAQPPPARYRVTPRHVLTVLLAQVCTVHLALWTASLLLIGLGGLVGLAIGRGDAAALPLAIVAPIAAALGVAFLYGGESDPAVELISATPISPRALVLARVAVVFGFNLGVSLIVSGGLALARADVGFGGLVLTWFAPMTLLSGLAFALSVWWFDPLASALIALCAWVLVVARHFDLRIGGDVLAFVPDVLLSHDYAVPMVAAAAVLVALAVWAVEGDERWAGR